MPSCNSINAALCAALIAAPLTSFAQIIPAPLPTEAGGPTYRMFLRGTPIGSEQIQLMRTADGWTIVSAGRIAAPIDVVGRRLQVRYTADWKPVDFAFDATVRGEQQSIRTRIEGTTATSDVTVNGSPSQKSDTIAADEIGRASCRERGEVGVGVL